MMIVLLLKAFVATLLIEEFVMCFWKERSTRLALVVLLANFITNPTINIIAWYVPNEVREQGVFVLGLELGVWVVETLLFFILGHIRVWGRVLCFTFALNACSYFSGDLLDYLGYWDW